MYVDRDFVSGLCMGILWLLDAEVFDGEFGEFRFIEKMYESECYGDEDPEDNNC